MRARPRHPLTGSISILLAAASPAAAAGVRGNVVLHTNQEGRALRQTTDDVPPWRWAQHPGDPGDPAASAASLPWRVLLDRPGRFPWPGAAATGQSPAPLVVPVVDPVPAAPAGPMPHGGAAAVPAPSTALLLGLTLAVPVGRRRRP